jgi:glycosyltransferase involved in cell wall biosynthesis
MLEKPIIICLTPVKNEAWILDRFLSAASLWADKIIIADQKSTDNSREIATSFEKVILINNDSETFNEFERQKLLIEEARKINGPRLLISLDADEVFTPNMILSQDWEKMLNSKPGTIIKFQWANILPGFKQMWLGRYFPWGYMDDGYQYEGSLFHSQRIPLPQDGEVLIIDEVKVMHFQYTQWDRMASKHRWYQCFDRINYSDKSAIEIFRQYHHMYGINKDEIVDVPPAWIIDYQKSGLDITTSKHESKNWWDDQVLDLMEEYGAEYFRKLSIWDANWTEIARDANKRNPEIFADPRNLKDRIIQAWLRFSQKNHLKRPFCDVDKFLQFAFRY